MEKITFPIEPGQSGVEVANLHQALIFLLEKGYFPLNEQEQRKVLTGLRNEVARKIYTDFTTKLVIGFQKIRGILQNGVVNEETAKAFNEVLIEMGTLEPEPPGPEPEPEPTSPTSPAQRMAMGKACYDDGKPLVKMLVRAFHTYGRTPMRLGEDTTDAEGRYTIGYTLPLGIKAVNLHVAVFDKEGKMLATSPGIENAPPLQIVDLRVPAPEAPTPTRRLEGQIVLENGLPAKNLTVRLYRRDFGGKTKPLVDTTTQADGKFVFDYDPGARSASLEVRAVTNGGEEIPLSKPVNTLAGVPVTLNLVAPSKLQPLASEYQRLSEALVPHVGDMVELANLVENDKQQDFTVLNRATGWDARLIALAARAEQLCADPEVGVPARALYGLLRAGLPAEKHLLAQIPVETAHDVWVHARDSGLIAADDEEIKQLTIQFNLFSSRARLGLTMPGSQSSYGIMLQSLGPFGIDETAQAKFASVYLAHSATPDQLWQKVKSEAGLTEKQVATLRLQGKYAYLSGNSAGMTTHLMTKGMDDPVKLVDQNLYTAEKWKSEIRTAAENDPVQLASLIPAAYTDANVEDRLNSYAEDMARKVRLSYPTQVLAFTLEQDVQDTYKLGAARKSTAALLKNAAGQGFRLGQTPVDAFFRTHTFTASGGPGFSTGNPTTDVTEIKKLQRVYQITPDDTAMQVLMNMGLYSAYDVMAYREADFIDRFTKKYIELHGLSEVWHKSYSGSWSGWNTIGGDLQSGPAACSWDVNRLDLFTRGTDNALWHKWYDGGSWHGWESLGGVLTSDPAAVSWSANRIDVFVRGTDNALWHRWYDGNWHNWETLGGDLRSGPAVSSWGANRLDVFARGVNNDLLHLVYNEGWQPWENLDVGTLVSDPEAVSWGPNRIDVFGRGADDTLQHTWFDGSWHAWESLGGVLRSGAAACSWTTNRLDVFVRGTDNAVWHKWWNGSWSDWESLSGIITADPAAVSWDPNRIDLFIRGPENASEDAARLVYRKARQVSSVTYNLFTIARTFESSPAIPTITGSVGVREQIRNELKNHFPTMETLFGSMDYCECEHCRSVLSPAAYLVDLLQFIDIEPEVWSDFLARWPDYHGEQPYPHRDGSGQALTPYDVLMERRPDLPNIPLTCENTNVALPYIDIVNEILEYYVANGALTGDAARDTGSATSSELLAEPQNVISVAYDRVQQTRYPLILPFDLWLETVREFCNYFEVPLARMIEALRPDETLFAPDRPFDRARMAAEVLGLSPAEWAIFTDPAPLDQDRWFDLYGYPTTRSAITNPTNSGNATLDILEADATHLRAGDYVTYFDTSDNILYSESKPIDRIEVGGTVPAQSVRIHFTGQWTTGPVVGDLLVMAVTDALKSAKALSRRLGVSYKELLEIIKTGFINPRLNKMSVLYKLGISIQSSLVCRDATNRAFYSANNDLLDKRREELSDPDKVRFDALDTGDWTVLNEIQSYNEKVAKFAAQYGITQAELETRMDTAPLAEILLLADPDTGCDFDKTILRYADGHSADTLTFLKINLFVRLWRRLGWSIAETDAALQAFIPANAPFDAAHLNDRPLQTALIYLAHLKTLNDQLNLGKGSRLKLASLWRDIATTGENSLYSQLFLTRRVLQNDPVFDHPLGEYLSTLWITFQAGKNDFTSQVEGVTDAQKLNPAWFCGHGAMAVTYDPLSQTQSLKYTGVLTGTEKANIIADAQAAGLTNQAVLNILTTMLNAIEQKGADYFLLKGHLLALQGTLGLTSGEIEAVLTDAGLSIDTADLSLPHVSLLFHYSLLSKALKLPVCDLIDLKALSGVDPFTALHTDPIATIDQDTPFSQTLRFVDIAGAVKASGLSIEDLNYLLRHRFDQVGKYRPNRAGTLTLLKGLADSIRAIRGEHAVPASAEAVSEELLRQKLSLGLTPDSVERLLGMLNTTVEFTGTLPGVVAPGVLTPADLANEPRIRAISYKEASNQEQKLTLRGVLYEDQKTAMLATLGLAAEKDATLTILLSQVQAKAREFFDNQVMKRPIGPTGDTGFLDEADYDELFLPLQPREVIKPDDKPEEVTKKLANNAAIEAANQTELQNRRFRVAQTFLPYLQERLIRQTIFQTLATQTGTDPLLVESLLTDPRLLTDPASGNTLLTVLKKVEERGLHAEYYPSTDASGAAHGTGALTDIDLTHSEPLKPAGTHSARITGYLEAPDPGAYRFTVVLDRQNATTELRFDHLPAPVVQGSASANGDTVGDVPSEYKAVDLQAGVLYNFTLLLTQLNDGSARMLVQGESLPRGPLTQLTLYPPTTIARAEAAVTLLSKTLQLVQKLGLSERALRHLLTNRTNFDNLDLSQLPTKVCPDTEAEATRLRALFAQFLRLAGYAHLARDLAGGTDDLISVFEASGVGDIETAYALLGKIVRRTTPVVKRVARALMATPNLNDERPVQRMLEVLQIEERFGVPVGSLLEWARILSPTATPKQRFAIARDLREAIKARFEPESWLRVAQPIFDRLRKRQRDALVAYVMIQHGFELPEELYDYFLIDPGMEPVVQTSRIRLAIASVQLFIQRSLLNLEWQVHPAAIINAGHWEWMKRYRVWEANRKIFLFPENWLEPEFRDDKTHLFKELEGTLLQSDVSNDVVEDAFLTYLSKLENLARLEILATHLETKDDRSTNILHVIGRTTNQPYQYFYRRYSHQMWTPWEPITTEVEGDHLAPVIWRNRLYLFWLTFVDDPIPGILPATLDPNAINPIPEAKKNVEIWLHWSEYKNGEWSTRESIDPMISHPIKKLSVSVNGFSPRSVFIHVEKESPGLDGEERGVYISMSGSINHAYYMAGRNSTPTVDRSRTTPEIPFGLVNRAVTRYRGGSTFNVNFKQTVSTDPNKDKPSLPEPILRKVSTFSVLPVNNKITPLGGPKAEDLSADNPTAVADAIARGMPELTRLMMPFFFTDWANTFYVEPDVTERTVEEWQEWVTLTQPPKQDGDTWLDPNWWKDHVEIFIPEIPPEILEPWGPIINPESIIKGQIREDWMLSGNTVLEYGGELIGQFGRTGMVILPPAEAFQAISEGGAPVAVQTGSEVGAGKVVVATQAAVQSGLAGEIAAGSSLGGLNVIGQSGVNAAIQQNVAKAYEQKVGAMANVSGNAGQLMR